MYRAYYGTAGCGPLQPLEKFRWPFRELTTPCCGREGVTAKGTTVLPIDGDDGTKLNQGEIALGVLRQRDAP